MQKQKELLGELSSLAALYRGILTNSSDVVLLADDSGNLIFVSPSVETILGYSVAEVETLGKISRWLGEDLPDAQAVRVAGEITNLERVILGKAGEVRIFLVNIKPVAIAASTLLYTFRDITERKQAEIAVLELNRELVQQVMQQTTSLQQTNQQLQQEVEERKQTEQALRRNQLTLMEAEQLAHVGSWAFEVATQEIFWSDEAYRIYGLDPAQPPPTYEQLLQLTHPDDLELFQTNVQAAIAEGQAYEHEIRILRPDGSLRYTFGRGKVECDASGAVQRLFGTVQDITLRKQNELARQQQWQREWLVTEIAQHVRQSLNFQEILETTVAEVRQFLQVNRVLIYQFDADWNGTVVAESVEAPWRSVQGRKIVDACLSLKACVIPYTHGHIQKTPDVAKAGLPDCYAEMLHQLQVQANLVIAVLDGPKLWGLLVAQHCAAPRHWQDWEIELLQQLSTHVSIALKQSQLYEQTVMLARRQALLKNLVDAIRQRLDLDAVLGTAAQQVRVAFGSSRSIVALCSANDPFFHHTKSASEQGIEATDGQRIPIEGNDHAETVLASADPVAVDDALTDPLMAAVLPLTQQLGIQAILAVSMRLDDEVKGILCVQQCQQPRQWTDEEKDLLKEVADQLAIAIHQAELYQQLQQANDKLQRLAKVDSLTQVANRHRLDEVLAREWQHAQRDRAPLGAILCDVDCFKRYNDTYGHQAGDDCLVAVARAIESAIKRSTDLVARYGGEEFVVILPNTTEAGVAQIAETICDRVRQLQYPHRASTVAPHLTISVGAASILPDADRSTANLLWMADRALYQAKQSGRDRVCLASMAEDELDSG